MISVQVGVLLYHVQRLPVATLLQYKEQGTVVSMPARPDMAQIVKADVPQSNFLPCCRECPAVNLLNS